MPITLFGFIWLAICIVLFFNRDIKKFVFLMLFSLVLQSTNVIAYNGISIGPAIITCFLFLLRYLIYHIENEMTLKFSFNKFNVILSI
ncbi:MAG: hypothetical protein K2I77_03430, partial [Anaeroplasmataceae bacterium]|nr:hypothetical protein [Anaeroplasmataceae bacterium]